MEITEIILYWVAIPFLITVTLFRLMLWHDKTSINDISPWSLALMILLSIAWPIGLLFMVCVIGEAYMRRWGWIK